MLAASRAGLDGLKALCAAHPGGVPVYVKLQDEGIALLLSREFWCDASEAVLAPLRQACGEQGVVLREGLNRK